MIPVAGQALEEGHELGNGLHGLPLGFHPCQAPGLDLPSHAGFHHITSRCFINNIYMSFVV